FSEEVTDKSLQFLGIKRNKSTRDLPIGGGRGYPRSAEERAKYIAGLAAWTGLSRERLEILFERYGSRAEVVAGFINKGEDAPVASLPEYTKREMLFMIQHEKVEHLDDLLLRRTMLAMLGRLTRDAINEVNDLLGNALGWDAAQKNVEAERTLRLLAEKYRVRL
ncbi:MAG: glycerol-3-phosphate dehydrogenase, partial [Chloroflexi bacterium CFX2]|nr:glycerol-3-phosphate dehydrogenase [Chloroflexi bacterium CFX2]